MVKDIRKFPVEQHLHRFFNYLDSCSQHPIINCKVVAFKKDCPLQFYGLI
jgi:hypothetical protein